MAKPMAGLEHPIRERKTEMTTVINRHHKVPYDVFIGRGHGSQWGNPFSHLENTIAEFKVDTREEAVREHRSWFLKQPKLLLDLYKLRGKILGCYCKPAACHGDTIIDLIENCYYVVVFGGRDFKDYELLRSSMDSLLVNKKEEYTIIIVSGRANGADKLGERYAKERGYEVAEFPVTSDDWNRLGKSAGHIRNREMAQLPYRLQGAAVGFYDGSSKGTGGMIKICEELKIDHRVITY